jgi:hypothetical protein
VTTNPRARARIRRHARKRAMERFGINLSRTVRASITSQILSGKGMFVSCGRDALRTCWLVIVAGKLARVVYDERLCELVTMYPARMQDKQRGHRR